VIDDEDQLSILRDIYKNAGIAQKDIKPKKALEIIGKVKMSCIQLESINSLDKAKELGIYKFDELKNVKYINRMYNQRLLLANLLDFDDLLLLTHKLLSEHADIKQK
jgi:DNA helicase-2/ATP-dependent DNA helicase PcrA